MGVSGQRRASAALYHGGKDPRYPLDRRLGGPDTKLTELLLLVVVVVVTVAVVVGGGELGSLTLIALQKRMVLYISNLGFIVTFQSCN
jgi:hypothetical protein